MLSRDLQRLKSTIRMCQGNLTQAATVLGVSKQHVMDLVRRNNLNEWARDLRVENGFPATGRPF